MLNMPMQISRFLATAQYLISIGLCPVLLDGKKPIFNTFDQYLPGPAGSDELALPLDKRPLRYTDDLLRLWAAEYPHANLGMLCRERPSIDIDAEHIWKAIKDLIPPTPHVKRGKKGWTFIYSVHPTDPVRRTRTFVDRFRQNKPDAMLLEVLAQGRQTVLPPSIHPEGMAYEWLAWPEWGYMLPTPLSAQVPPPLSQATVDAIAERLESLGITKPRVERGKGLATAIPAAERGRYMAYLAPKLAEKLQAVREATAGSRQDAVNGACYALAPWVREGFIEETWLEDQLREACELNGWLRDDGERPFARQVTKGLDDGWQGELPDLDAGRADKLLGAAPLASGSLPAPSAGPYGPATSIWEPVELEANLVDDLIEQPAAPREWTVPGWIPHKQVTLIYGDGGTGKTTLLMQLAMMASKGGKWFGHQVHKRKVLFISAEDEKAELQFRFQQMSKLLGKGFPSLTVVSLADLETCELMSLEGNTLRPTGVLEAVCAMVRAQGIDMVMLDPVADMFGGNEIDKRQVTKFMRTIRKRLAFDLGCTVVVAGHPSSQGIQRGTGESGSKAWSNSARSRCYFERQQDGETLTLELMKANRAKLGDKIAMKWVDGVFVQVANEAKAIIAPEQEAKIMARLEREGPIYVAGSKATQWIGKMIGLELGKDLATRDGRHQVDVLVDGWEKLGYVKKLRMAGKNRNYQEFIELVSYPGLVVVDASTKPSTNIVPTSTS